VKIKDFETDHLLKGRRAREVRDLAAVKVKLHKYLKIRQG
jgi:hypothetical protein